MREPLNAQDDVTRALRMLGQARPPEGMEARIAERVRVRQAEAQVAGRRIFSGRMVLAGAMVAACVMVAVVARHHGEAAVKDPAGSSAHVLTAATLPRLAQAQVAATRHARILRAPVERGLVSFPARGLVSFPAPAAPLTEQERLLLTLAQRPGVVAGLGSVATSETVVDHGVGENAIFELDHEELAQLKSTLQLTPLKNTLPPPHFSGDIE